MNHQGKHTSGSGIAGMFDGIAPTYDALNHVLSLGIDRLWRRRAIRQLQGLLHVQPEAVRTLHSSLLTLHFLDVATGTGDLAIEAHRRLGAHILGIDISDGMLALARQKVERAGLSEVITLRHEDCATLSLPSESIDAVISAFALRNFAQLLPCLSQMARVLKPGAPAVVIDLCAPRHFPMKQLFHCYQHILMPLCGRLIAHDKSAYTYLPSSMQAVAQGEDMAALFRQAGFTEVQYTYLFSGMCVMYTGLKPA